ncbi:hypothetical protein FM112_13135 [Gulosibacter sp. 10]|nr:hypothetical protein FM112_13135 [Gulosibacter sp. 10]
MRRRMLFREPDNRILRRICERPRSPPGNRGPVSGSQERPGPGPLQAQSGPAPGGTA